MGQNIQSLIGQLDQTDTLDDLQSIILTLRDQFRIDHAVYHWISSDGEQFGCGTYPTDWVQTYVDNDYLRVDPVVIGSSVTELADVHPRPEPDMLLRLKRLDALFGVGSCLRGGFLLRGGGHDLSEKGEY